MIVRPERYPVSCPVRFTHERGVTGEGSLINLSLKGCAFRSQVLMEEGMLLALQMQSAAITASVHIEMARIQWVNNDACGIEFLYMHEQERKVLLHWVRALAAQFIH